MLPNAAPAAVPIRLAIAVTVSFCSALSRLPSVWLNSPLIYLAAASAPPELRAPARGGVAAGRGGQAAQCGVGQQVAEAAFGVAPFEFLSDDIGCGRGGGVGGYASAALGGGAQPGTDHIDGYAGPLPSFGLLPFGFGFFA